MLPSDMHDVGQLECGSLDTDLLISAVTLVLRLWSHSVLFYIFTPLQVDLSLSIVANIYNRAHVVSPSPNEVVNDTEEYYRPCDEWCIIHRRRRRRIGWWPEAEEPYYKRVRTCENAVNDT